MPEPRDLLELSISSRVHRDSPFGGANWNRAENGGLQWNHPPLLASHAHACPGASFGSRFGDAPHASTTGCALHLWLLESLCLRNLSILNSDTAKARLAMAKCSVLLLTYYSSGRPLLSV